MTYSAAVAYLLGLQKHGIKLGLETMTALARRLGEPQRRYRSLHIGGTNGKGSTAAMVAGILQSAGYRVGLYTSPHLVEFRERIRVDGAMISEDAVARCTAAAQVAAGTDLQPTFFESTTAMAFQYFAEAQVDVAVLEVGLGGRFDATNIVQPEACAITTVALDHQEYLGSTVSAIAFEKAGIVKEAIPLVVGRMTDEAMRTIEGIARERNSPLSALDREFRIEGVVGRFTYVSRRTRYADLRCALPGAHQVDNAACAIAVIEAAGGLQVGERAVRDGVGGVQWEGRLETLEARPDVLLDGAHNPAGAEALAAYLRSAKQARPGSRVIVVVGMMRDKDHKGFMKSLNSVADHIVLTRASIARSATAEELRDELAGMITAPFSVTAGPAEALALARRLAASEDVICVTGSLMLIGEVKASWRGCGLSPLRG
ncbi:Bifunctional protein FolC: Folylpolyglutamate synthase and Dihydrofolate synthase [Nitrospira japonica]|uniref:Dihydrofolate synthase/folylpolyglutamate synthase n=1 Tax=Nitrospira japonica TaxID=1325564 RepID=A0A1W1I732_9BACT|nr:folylpolyglutamate synthase/dihydrofolate synthase family protein [Nitrospira japonica]SLM48817.1 Bifunctional protein FolC: Folylpolyglutamate synthase and Dihydrofolate synthase [Nitrospira japonica]